MNAHTKSDYQSFIVGNFHFFHERNEECMNEDFKKITVVSGKRRVDYNNPTSIPFIGKGYTGAVFKLSSHKCVKIFAKEIDAHYEATALKIGQQSAIFPKLYQTGPNYIIMEYLQGPDLHEHLTATKTLPDKIAKQILYCLHELKRLKIPRNDVRIRHFLFTKKNKLKIIDHAYATRKKSTIPRSMFKDLEKLGLLNDFLEYVKKNNPSIYTEWGFK